MPVCLLLALLLIAGPALPQAPIPPAQAPVPPPPAAAPFASGETLTYQISWRLFGAGEARMHLESRGADAAASLWQATLNVTSAGFVSLLYKVDDTVVSTFRDGKAGRMCSVSLLKTQNEGRRHRETRIDFHSARSTASIRETDLSKGQVLRQAEEPMPPCAYDILSALYYVRSLPLEVGRKLELPVTDGGKTLSITVEVQAKEEVKTGAGVFPTIRVEPKVFSGSLFKRSGRMQIWFSDDPQRLLVQLKAKLFFGTVSAVLQQKQ
jgi:hypothetical protein